MVELGAPAGGYGWLFPKGDHANLGVGGWASEGPHLRDHLARLAAPTAIDPDVLTDVRGHRLPMRRVGATSRPQDNVLLVGDAAGLVDPLSGDGMYEAFTSARLAAEAILAGDSTRTRRRWRRRSTTTQARRGLRSARSTATRRCASGQRALRACSASSRAAARRCRGIRTRRGGSPGRRCGSFARLAR